MHCLSLLNLDVQEEERERRMDFVPEESAVNTEQIEVSSQPWFSSDCLMASTVVLHILRDKTHMQADMTRSIIQRETLQVHGCNMTCSWLSLVVATLLQRLLCNRQAAFRSHFSRRFCFAD